MAFIQKTISKTRNASGQVIEKGTWELTALDTAGVIVAAGDPLGSPKISGIDLFAFTNDNSNAVAQSQSGLPPDQIQITATALDTGGYTIMGPAV